MNTMEGHVVADAVISGFRITDEIYEAGSELHAHVHEDPHLVVLLNGLAEEETGADSRSLESSALIHFPESMQHTIRFPRLTTLVSIEVDRARQELIRELQGGLSHFWIGSGPEIVPITHAIRQELRRTGRVAGTAIEGLTLQLIVKGIRALGERDQAPPIVRAAREYIEAHYADRIGLGSIARALEVSPGHLARLHRDWYGMSVGEWIRKVRVERAKEMIVDGCRSLGEIALDTGFCDQPHFAHAFRDVTGMTPSRFREQARLNAP